MPPRTRYDPDLASVPSAERLERRPSQMSKSGSSSSIVSSRFPFRLGLRKTGDRRFDNKPAPAPPRPASPLLSLPPGQDSGIPLANRSRLKDIFSVPSHKATTAAPATGPQHHFFAASTSDDEDDLSAPRVGRPRPGPSQPLLNYPTALDPRQGGLAGPLPPQGSGTELQIGPPQSHPVPRPEYNSGMAQGTRPMAPLPLPQADPTLPSMSNASLSQPPAYAPPPSKARDKNRQLNPVNFAGDESLSTSAYQQQQQQQGQQGGRFPRWRGWLEKRALERHLERMNLQSQNVARKKSWGAGIHDPDAISDDEEGQPSETMTQNSIPIMEPLHLHHFGSRFLPHIPSQPLCAVYMDIPYPTEPIATGMRIPRRPRHKRTSRHVLLIGTADGLFAAEHRPKVPESQHQQSPDAPRPFPSASTTDGWNENVRCTQIWKGLGIYHLAVLHSAADGTEVSSPSSASLPLADEHRNTPQEQPMRGVVLGLCANTEKKALNKPPVLTRISSHTNTVLEHSNSAAGLGKGPSSSSLGSHGHGGGGSGGHLGGRGSSMSNRTSLVSDDTFLAPSFGPGAGGGIGKIVPPGGSGVVKMWNLEAVRRVVAYVMNEQAPALDLSSSVQSKRSSALSGALKLPAKLKGAWATLAEPRTSPSPLSERRRSRRAESDGYGIASPYFPPSSPPLAACDGRVNLHRKRTPVPLRRSSRGLETFTPTSPPLLSDADSKAESGTASPMDEAQEETTERHARALKLAQSCMPINYSAGPLNQQRSEGSEAGSPLQSMFNVEAKDNPLDPVTSRDSQATNSGVSNQGHASGASHSSHAHTKGCLFFAVYQSPAGFKGAGTWYLALASSRGILLYEATPPRKPEQSRTWSFLKELYTPLSPKAMAFVPASTASGDPSVASARPTHSRMSSLSKLSLPDDPPRSSSAGGDPGVRQNRQTWGGAGPSAKILPPQHGSGSAGPTSWNRADLSLFVSFGRRAVMIRLSDAHVREIDLLSAPFSNPDGSGSRLQNSQGLYGDTTTASAGESHKLHHRKRPSSESGRVLMAASTGGHATTSQSNKTTKASQYWIGLQHVQARLTIRQDVSQASAEQTRHRDAFPLTKAANETDRVTTRARGGVAMVPTLSDSAARSVSTNPLLADDADSSMESDGEGGIAAPRYKKPSADFPGVTLYDRSIRAHHRGSASDSDILNTIAAAQGIAPETQPTTQDTLGSSQFRNDHQWHQASTDARRLAGQNSAPSARPKENFFDLTAHVTVMSRGQSTHVLPWPLPADMADPPTLDIVNWSGLPNAVTGWSRVLGVEQVMTAGPQAASTLSTLPRRESRNTPPSGTAANTIRLRVSLTLVAFLEYKVEMQRVTVHVDVPRPLDLMPNAEMHLCSPGDANDTVPILGPDSAPCGRQPIPNLDSSLRTTLQASQHQAEMDLDYPMGFIAPTSQVGGSIDGRILGTSMGSPREDQRSTENTSTAATVAMKEVIPYEAAGDGGAWTFTYRGGDDYRICYVGAEV
ncbi:unnamed protein product [Sympodiomycopsis kandeliae]